MARIAFVDDALESLSLAEALRERGHTVETFPTALAAFHALLEQPPQLLVCGGGMRGALDMVAGLRAAHPPEALPILALVEDEREEDYLRCYRAGCDECLPRPVSEPRLLARCAQLLREAARPRGGETEVRPGALLFGRYEVRSLLGEGSYGRVFRARDAEAGGEVALKLLRPQFAHQPEARMRFQREVYAAGLLRDPRLVRLVDRGQDEDLGPYCALELVPGPSLFDQVWERDPADEGEAWGLLEGLAEALVALEEARLVHRDIKPENVILRGGRFDQPVLIDLGLAKRGLDRALTNQDYLMGTPAFMAPEVILGDAPDGRCDQFSAGVLVCFALTGDTQTPSGWGEQLLVALAARRVVIPAWVSPPLAGVLRRLTQRRAGDRYPTAAALLAAVRGALASRDDQTQELPCPTSPC